MQNQHVNPSSISLSTGLPMMMLTAALSVSLASADTVSISGTVTNKSGQPLAGVAVKLMASPQISDTTGADGKYSLIGETSALRAQTRPDSRALGYAEGRLRFKAAASGPVSIRLFDAHGALLVPAYHGWVGSGRDDIAFSLASVGRGLGILQVTLEGMTSTYKVMSFGNAITLALQNEVAAKSDASGTARGSLGKSAVAGLEAGHESASDSGMDWMQASKSGYASHMERLTSYSGVIDIVLETSVTPDFGKNVFVFDPSMSMSTIQSQLTNTFNQNQSAQFGGNHFAYLFKPGKYAVDVNVPFYTEAVGLGLTPDSVAITGQVHSEADWMGGNATCTFWRSASNMSVTPPGGTNRWAVSQGAPFRRMHVKGNLVLDDGGWSSGGYIGDSKIDGSVNSGSQQQWFSRNADWGSWGGNGWNMVFVGIQKPPTATSWPNPPYTVIAKTPVIREKPFLIIDETGNYSVMVPALTDSSIGTTWSKGPTAGTQIPIDQFYFVKTGDNAASINAALSQGKNLLVTPGVYHLESSLQVTRPGTVVLGLGLPSFVPDKGTPAITTADADGIIIAGLILEANQTNSPTLLQVGPALNGSKSAVNHAANPISLTDIFCRAGGSFNGLASSMVTVNSNDVIIDHFWLWRADHGAGAGWNSNKADNGLTVNGDNVTAYGLFVEHCQKYQTQWNGNHGRTFFYQSEMPYDPPNQSSWMNGTVKGFASYHVGPDVTTHEAWGIGVYCVFYGGAVFSDMAIETPTAPGISMNHLFTISLGGNSGGINSVINGKGGAVNGGNFEASVK